MLTLSYSHRPLDQKVCTSVGVGDESGAWYTSNYLGTTEYTDLDELEVLGLRGTDRVW